MKKLVWLLAVAAVAGAVVWGVARKNAPPDVRFASVVRQALIATLPTNGKVEPYEWQSVRVETAGLVNRLPVHNGDRVAKGAVLAELTNPEARAGIESAQARVNEAQANLRSLEAGKPAERTDIENSLERARLNLEIEQKDYDALKRLVNKQAATPAELQTAGDKLRQTRVELEGLQKRLPNLISKPETEAANARLADAESALRLAQKQAGNSQVTTPIGGEIYELGVRAGSYVNPGDLVANVGVLVRVRVRVYVDEPLLGRVKPGAAGDDQVGGAAGEAVAGRGDQMPVSIQTLGARQVGEVICVIENPGRDLIPGVNVDAEIRTAETQAALVVPKEALRRDNAGDFVLRLAGDHVERRAVQLGISSVTQAQVTGGLSEGDQVALPSDTPLKNGSRVNPIQ